MAVRKPPCVRLILAGDVMTGRGIDQILPCAGDPQIYESYLRSAEGYVALAEALNGRIPAPVPFTYVWGGALSAMATRQPDCRLVNLETAVTRCDDAWPGKGINYRMHPGNIPVLTSAGIDICSLANNHVLDWGYDGLAETLHSLQRAGVKTVGAGRDRDAAASPAIMHIGNNRLLVFAVGHHSSGIPAEWAATTGKAGVNFIDDLSAKTAQALTRQWECYRQPGDLVIVSIHWGGNWGYAIERSKREFAHHLIDGGADLIFCHSSHHPMGIEVYRERAIFYGCGDLINDYEGIGGHENYRSHLRLLYCVDLKRESGALGGLELIPWETCRFRLRAPAAADRDWLLGTLGRECHLLGATLALSDGGESFLLRW
ncbi:CapA family protein [Microbulbifer harenosus]|uniref:CapA family protein n=1 Tax=Microbulbifer harenosus TaxID=2576840 RepID=A0ABY2UJ34_9GAMM|nr:CapA family protein [Microbulbifer harenosus]TLM77701.1 CapA family protein [Microbulbifer harenosus]